MCYVLFTCRALFGFEFGEIIDRPDIEGVRYTMVNRNKKGFI